MKIGKIVLLVHHVFNPLHVYCRLMKLGLSERSARNLSMVYERGVFVVVRQLMSVVRRMAKAFQQGVTQ